MADYRHSKDIQEVEVMTIRRLLAFVIAMAMVMGIVPAMSITAVANSAEVVATIDGAEYTSLAGAIEAAKKAFDGGAVTVENAVLVSDCELADVTADVTGTNSDETMFGYLFWRV